MFESLLKRKENQDDWPGIQNKIGESWTRSSWATMRGGHSCRFTSPEVKVTSIHCALQLWSTLMLMRQDLQISNAF